MNEWIYISLCTPLSGISERTAVSVDVLLHNAYAYVRVRVHAIVSCRK